ncbi:hypothetical protein ACHAAC_01120 [Aeromicrobium sp. CF4.19]|uniref:hypothetical protein n=1 Tax=Aeromicrobium sp. CF4.19 TaxID=3373082 RepID=UPI003EE52CD2
MGGSLLFVVVCTVLGLVLVLAAVFGSSRLWLRWVTGVVGVVVAVLPVLLVAGFLLAQPEPLEPDETLAMGVRVDDGVAHVWLGPGCEEVERLQVSLKVQGAPDTAVLELRADGPAVTVEELGLTPDSYPDGMSAVEPLPQEALDLEQHRSLGVEERRGATVLLQPALEGSAARPGELWLGEELGWMTPEDAVRGVENGDLSTICMPAPDGTYGS